MKAADFYFNIDETLFQDIATGKYYVMKRERANELNGIIKRYGGRNLVPNTEKISVREAQTVYQHFSNDFRISFLPIRLLMPIVHYQ